MSDAAVLSRIRAFLLATQQHQVPPPRICVTFRRLVFYTFHQNDTPFCKIKHTKESYVVVSVIAGELQW